MNVGNGIILEGTLRKCKKHKLFKTKWVERYFVLYPRDGNRNSYSLDEYKSYRKKELKKTVNLELVNRVESNLSVSGPSISCSARSDSLNYIFSIGFSSREVHKDIYLAAQNQEVMNKWVRELCRACNLLKEQSENYQDFGGRSEIERSQFPSSSAIGLSDSTDSLDNSIADQQSLPDPNLLARQSSESENHENYESLLYYENGESENRVIAFNFGGSHIANNIQQQYTRAERKISKKKKKVRFLTTPIGIAESDFPGYIYPSMNALGDYFRAKWVNIFMNGPYLLNPTGNVVTAEDKGYIRLQNCSTIEPRSSYPKDANYSNLMAESCSETSSMYSSRKNVTTTEEDTASCTSGPPIPPPRTRYQNKFAKNGTMNKLNTTVASTSMGTVTNENDSSGETLKMETDEMPNAESIDSSEGFGGSSKRSGRRAPPPIDRTNKPKNLRLEDKHYRNISRTTSMDKTGGATRHYTSYSRTLTSDISSKRKNLDYFEPSMQGIRVPVQKMPSTRSPTPSDIEYISVDVDRTLAFKQMRRAAPASMD